MDKNTAQKRAAGIYRDQGHAEFAENAGKRWKWHGKSHST